MEHDAFRRELLDSVWTMERVMRKHMVPICQRHGITIQQLHVLMNLSKEPGVTAGELSDRSGILRTNFTALCRKMEEAGLIERRRSERDRRSLELQITDEGRALLTDIEDDARQEFEPVLAEEPPETFEAISTGLCELNRLAGKLTR